MRQKAAWYFQNFTPNGGDEKEIQCWSLGSSGLQKKNDLITVKTTFINSSVNIFLNRN